MKSQLICFVFILCFFLPSCAKKEESVRSRTIGVSILTRAEVFYKDLEEGLKSEAKKNNFELIIATGEFDLGKQTAQIEDFITQKVDAIVVCPARSRLIRCLNCCIL